MAIKKTLAHQILLLSTALALLAGIYWILEANGFVELMMDAERSKSYIISIGYWGILLIIALMAFAILFKLLPSAAVALASGAVYGHTWGTVYIVIGAWLGAIIAFSVTRVLGNDAMCKLFKHRMHVNQEQSQSWLMWGLFVSRLIPAIPYDIVSYAMGLTPLKLWRFSIATLVGVIPTSFFLAHVGGELIETNLQETLAGMMKVGAVLLAPVAAAVFIMHRYGKFKDLLIMKQCEK